MTQRHPTKAEAENVAKYIEATLALKANVTYHTVADFTAPAGNVLLLAQTADAAKAAFSSLPLWSEGVAALVEAASEGKIFSSFFGAQRIAVGLVPTKASRHNCQWRPDVITTLVGEALGDGKKVAALDVISAFPREAELAVASAIAKAGRSFKSQDGAWDHAYTGKETVAIRAFLSGPLASSAEALGIVATNVQLCARLLDAPTNILDTLSFAEIAKQYAAKYGFQYSEIVGEELREKGYGGIYGVGKGAEYPPVLVTLSYSPQNGIDPQKKIALVGKGMVYDTGGLAIKTPVAGMFGMKSDMGGAAAVFCGFLTAVQLKAPVPLDCVLCLADNAISARAFRNGDILIFKSGRTCEVNNTDAEGRLVLSDGVFHAANETASAPSTIIDMATLTGAQGIATGVHHAAIYTTSEEWENKLLANGKVCGDLLFPVVYAPEFHSKEYATKVADCRNLMARTANAGISCGGNFIEANLPKDFKGEYVHIDLAFPAFQGDLGTGYGVTLLAQTLVPIFSQKA